jgi:hypothetical protein
MPHYQPRTRHTARSAPVLYCTAAVVLRSQQMLDTEVTSAQLCYTLEHACSDVASLVALHAGLLQESCSAGARHVAYACCLGACAAQCAAHAGTNLVNHTPAPVK